MLGLILTPPQPQKVAPPVAPALTREAEWVVAVLTEARRMIATCGWTWWAWRGTRGERCTVTAIRDASISLYGYGHPAETFAMSAFARAAGILPADIQYWNDMPWRTKDRVLRTFSRAIRRPEV